MENNQVFQQDFDEKFSAYKEKRIAIYGNGQNAKLIEDNVVGYDIVGFISRDGEKGMLSGLLMMPISEAVQMVEVIIIAATVSSTNIIFSRIKEDIPAGIKVLDLYGETLNKEDSDNGNLYWGKSYKQLCSMIDGYRILSFDIFDTLLMRETLRPADIFCIIEDKCIRNKLNIEFKQWREDAEQKCARCNTAPSIKAIYQYLKKEHQVADETIALLEAWEYEQERKHIIARQQMVNLYNYALAQGKKIFLTSDMYFSAEFIRELLEICGIESGYELLVSCEFDASKKDGSLYDVLKKRIGEEKVLHIGDNADIDGREAEKRGIDSFLVASAYELLTISKGVRVFDDIRTKDDENYLGYFCSRILNSPFELSKYQGKFHLKSYEDIALIIYPITIMFINFIIRNAAKYDCIIFPSRDGYFLYRLYEKIKNDNKELKLPDAKYVYASRMALSRAAMQSEESYMVLIDKLFSNQTINCKEYIRNQFNIELSEEYDVSCGELIERWGKEELISKLKGYFIQIRESLKGAQSAYLEYLSAMEMKQYQSLALVDIVSYGTQIYCLSQILGKKIDLIALGTTAVPNVYVDAEDRVCSVYGNVNKRIDGAIYSCSNLSVLHLFLEMLYSSTDGQFVGIDCNQEPYFLDKTEYNGKLTVGVQEEIVKIFDAMLNAGFGYKDISKEFAMGMLQLLFSKYSVMDKQLKEQFAFSDPYMGGLKTVNLVEKL